MVKWTHLLFRGKVQCVHRKSFHSPYAPKGLVEVLSKVRFLTTDWLGITDSLETNEMIYRARVNSTFWKSYLNCNLVDNTLVKNLVAKLNHVYV